VYSVRLFTTPSGTRSSSLFLAISNFFADPIASYIANEPIRGERTSKSGRNGRICGETLFIDNVGINKSFL
jgi:hypothetical protein